MRILFLFFILGLSHSTEARNLILTLGQDLRWPAKTSDLWIEDQKVLRGQHSSGFWILRGLKEGNSDILANGELHHVQVLLPSHFRVFSALQTHLKNVVGLQPEVSEGQIALRGRLYRWEDWLWVSSFFREHSTFFRFEAEIPVDIQEQAQDYFQRKFEEKSLMEQSILFDTPPELRLSETQEHGEKYKELLRPFGIQILKTKNSVEMRPTVRLEMTIVEINRNLKRRYGWSWPDHFTAQIQPELKWSAFSSDLNLLEEKGEAKVLASPNLLSRSGQEAEFLVGGEFPIKVSSKGSRSVIWKNYGISLKFLPTADSSGRMSISMNAEVSSLDPSLSVDGVPAMKTQKVSSHFDLLKSRLIALSGLLKEDDGHNVQGLPGLSSLPLIGPLFGSQNFLKSQSELIIFVRPSLAQLNSDSTIGKQQEPRPKHLENP